MTHVAVSFVLALAAAAQAQPASPEPQGAPPQATAPAEEHKSPSWTDRVKLSGKVYLRYSFELSEPAASANQFAIDRLYLQGEFQLTDTVRFQYTLDAGDIRSQGSSTPFVAETKYAFVEIKDLLVKGTFLRAGVVPMSWIPYEEELLPYRVASQVPLDRWGYTTSADLGIGFGFNLPAKLGNVYLNLSNGEGYKSPELYKGKELQARLTVTPLASLGGILGGAFVTADAIYGRSDDADLPSRTKVRLIGQVGLKSEPLIVALEYLLAWDANAKVKSRFTVGPEDTVPAAGLSAFATLRLGELWPMFGGLDVFARYDGLDPDVGLAANDVSLFIAGVGYRWIPAVKSALSYESVTYGAAASKPGEGRLKVVTEVRF